MANRFGVDLAGAGVVLELLVDLFDVRLSESGKNVKRLMDIMVSALALVLLSPLLLLVSLAVKFTSEGPVIYKQERVGLKGKLFNIYKFRTMTDARDEKGALLTDDQRLPKFGQRLRSWQLKSCATRTCM